MSVLKHYRPVNSPPAGRDKAAEHWQKRQKNKTAGTDPEEVNRKSGERKSTNDRKQN